MIDFHTHILPGIDDGSATAEESVKMLKLLEKQGVSKVLLTPHFYAHRDSVDEFVGKRKSAVKKLLAALEEEKITTELFLGCEVLYFDELWRIDNLNELCIQGTSYILLEMPFAPWDDETVKCTENLISKGYTPVIAHFERYIKFGSNLDKIYKFMESGALLQMNCSYLNRFLTRARALRFIKKGMVFAIGTDCHNLDFRAPNYLPAYDFIKKRLNERQLRKFVTEQRTLLKQAEKIR